jgi:hypothetical protein
VKRRRVALCLWERALSTGGVRYEDVRVGPDGRQRQVTLDSLALEDALREQEQRFPRQERGLSGPQGSTSRRHVPTGERGIYYSILRGGEKVFEIRYTGLDGKQKYKVAGRSMKQARQRLREAEELLADNQDPGHPTGCWCRDCARRILDEVRKKHPGLLRDLLRMEERVGDIREAVADKHVMSIIAKGPNGHLRTSLMRLAVDAGATWGERTNALDKLDRLNQRQAKEARWQHSQTTSAETRTQPLSQRSLST